MVSGNRGVVELELVEQQTFGDTMATTLCTGHKQVVQFMGSLPLHYSSPAHTHMCVCTCSVEVEGGSGGFGNLQLSVTHLLH